MKNSVEQAQATTRIVRVLAGMALVVFLIAMGLLCYNSSVQVAEQCETIAERTGLSTRNEWDGCYVEVEPGAWVKHGSLQFVIEEDGSITVITDRLPTAGEEN